MKAIFNKSLIGKVMAALMCVALYACSNNEPEPESPSGPEPEGYCLMYYCSGGDAAHDLTTMAAVQSAADVSNDEVTVTCLFKFSGEGEGEAHNGIRRYTGESGRLTVDDTFSAPGDFEITDSRNLADFIKWSAQVYPGRKYILVFAGHGATFRPEIDLPAFPDSRATVSDGRKIMATYQVAEGIRDSGIHLAAMIAHSCQQGSIEMLAEWEGLTDYLLGSPFSIPDVAHDYASFVGDLTGGISLEDALKRTAGRTISLWKEYHDSGYFGEVIELTRLDDLSAVWSALDATFAYMKTSVNGLSSCTDAPSVNGERYGRGYLRALTTLTEKRDEIFEKPHPSRSVDLVDYLRNACIHTGNVALTPYVNKVQQEIDKILVYHEQTNGRHDFIYNVYFSDKLAHDDMVTRYHQCRFDQLTGWSGLCQTLLTDYSDKTDQSQQN